MSTGLEAKWCGVRGLESGLVGGLWFLSGVLAREVLSMALGLLLAPAFNLWFDPVPEAFGFGEGC